MNGPENPASAAGESPAALASLKEEERATALERFRVLQLYLEQGRFLTEVATAAGIPYRTLRRWASHYRQAGLMALVRRGRADKGDRRGVCTPDPGSGGGAGSAAASAAGGHHPPQNQETG